MAQSQDNFEKAGAHADRQGGLWGKVVSWLESDEDAGPRNLHRSIQLSENDPVWPKWRTETVQTIFGNGRIGPGGHPTVKAIIDRLDLPQDSKVVELGCGFGGLAAGIASGAGASVWAFDDRIPVADAAVLYTSGHPGDAHVVVDRRDLNDTGIRPGFADGIIAKESLTPYRNKRQLVSMISRMIKASGTFVMSDFFVTGQDEGCPEVAVWSALEERPMYPGRLAPFIETLQDTGFLYPQVEDITREYIAEVCRAFADVQAIISAMENKGDTEIRQRVVQEAEYWERRTALLESGEVKLYRLTAKVDRY